MKGHFVSGSPGLGHIAWIFRVDNRSFCPTVFQSSLEAAIENQIANLPDTIFIAIFAFVKRRERLSIRAHLRHNRFLNKACSICP